MFKFENQKCKLTSVNPRIELHGEDKKAAVDLKFKTTMPNSALDMFDDRLKTAFFKPVLPGEGDLADQGMDDDYMPLLKFNELTSFPWNYTGAGYRVVIPLGVSGDNDINLIQCKLDKFVIECKQGGRVEIEFRVITHPNQKEMGQLCSLLKSEIDVTLIQPPKEDQLKMYLEELDEFDPAA